MRPAIRSRTAHVINMADGAALRALVEKERPHIIVPEIEAIATDMLAQIEKEGIATVIPAARGATHHEPRRHPPAWQPKNWTFRRRAMPSPRASTK